jgi:hypothetical protein
MFSKAEAGCCGVPTRLLVLFLASTVLTPEGAFFEGLPEAAMLAAAGLCADFLVLAVFLVAVTFGCSGAFVTG